VDIFFDQNDNGLPGINLSDHCSQSFPGLPDLLDCPQVASDILSCQQQGIKVMISLGGASGAYGFTSASQAETFAQTIWNLFLGGSSSTRPFGSSILDGVDLDIEGGSPNYYANFVSSMRSLMNGGNKKYYISGAPQCPYPDAYLGPALQSNGFDFDYIWVQFYNNYCDLTGGSFNFNTWANSASSNTVVLVGLPASPQAAGSGYVPADQLQGILQGIQGNPKFGGVMLWDAGWNEQSGYSTQVASILGIN
jgi:chitinase